MNNLILTYACLINNAKITESGGNLAQTKMTPKVSVIIPTFREERYIAVILSKLVKIRPEVEIIVVDSRSEDETAKIAEFFTSKVYQIGERGISKARNHGAKKANGEILVFLDADVNLPPCFVKKVLETFNDTTVVGATCSIIPAQPSFLETVFFMLYNFLIRVSSRFKPHSRGEFLAVRKEQFLRAGGFDEDLPCLEDHDMAYRLSELGKFVFIKDLTVYESMRRFRKLGFFRVVGTWFMDYVSFVLRGKPVSVVWQPHR